MMSMERNSEDGAQLSPKPQQIEMFPSGTYVDLLNPDPDTILLEDIAHHLSLICRYNGGVRRFYSVAEHSILVADLLKYVPYQGDPDDRWIKGCNPTTDDLRKAALMHDAAEAYIGDMTAPCKWALRQVVEEWSLTDKSEYDLIGDKLDEVIAAKYAIEYLGRPELRIADLWAMRIEARQLTASKGEGWRWPGELPYDGLLPDDVLWYGGLSAELAEQMFLRKYQELFALAIR